MSGTVPKNVGGPRVLKQVKYLAKDVSVRPESGWREEQPSVVKHLAEIFPAQYGITNLAPPSLLAQNAEGDLKVDIEGKPLLCNGKSMVLAIRQLGDQNLEEGNVTSRLWEHMSTGIQFDVVFFGSTDRWVVVGHQMTAHEAGNNQYLESTLHQKVELTKEAGQPIEEDRVVLMIFV
jgi:hypothetical protein